MAGQGEKGKFSAEISQDVIEAALESVKRRTGHPMEASADVTTEEFAVDPDSTGTASGEPSLSAANPAEVAALREELQALRAQLELSQAKGREMLEKVKESHERMLRAVADLDNFKKRAQKEKEELTRFGAERLLKDFLPVIDNLDRALEHSKTATDMASFRDGVAITRKLFDDMLARHGVKSFSAKGQPFDPRFHEAMSQVETSELPPAHVVLEAVRGYMLHDRLIRPALVTVSQAPSRTQQDSNEVPSSVHAAAVTPTSGEQTAGGSTEREVGD